MNMEVKKLEINLKDKTKVADVSLSISEDAEDDYENEEFEEYEDDFEYLTDESEGVIQQNKTFPEEKLRDIERKNAILMDKILANNKRRNQYKFPIKYNGPAISSAAINRKKNQIKINYENQASTTISIFKIIIRFAYLTNTTNDVEIIIF